MSTTWQKKAFTKLLGLRYKISYHQGKSNAAADALSRKSHDSDAIVAAISTCQPLWLTEISDGYAQDSKARTIMQALAVDKDAVPKFTLTEGILGWNGRIWVGDNKELQLKLFTAFHTSSMGGHYIWGSRHLRATQIFFRLARNEETNQVLGAILILRLKLHPFLWITFSSCIACLSLLCLIEILCLQVTFGQIFSKQLALNSR